MGRREGWAPRQGALAQETKCEVCLYAADIWKEGKGEIDGDISG